jgi:hypothetical protein
MKKYFLCAAVIMLTVALNAGMIRWHNTPDCRDKEYWNCLKSHPQYENLMKRADEAVSSEVVSPLPRYLEFTQTGNRSNYERCHNQLRKFGQLIAAYCTTGNVRYLKNIEERIKIILSLPTWIISAPMGRQIFELEAATAVAGSEKQCSV